MRRSTLFAFGTCVLLLAACGNVTQLPQPSDRPSTVAPAPSSRANFRGLYELKVTVEGGQVTAQALRPQALTELGGLQISEARTSVLDDSRDRRGASVHRRHMVTTFKVTNGGGAAITDLTLVPVALNGYTEAGTFFRGTQTATGGPITPAFNLIETAKTAQGTSIVTDLSAIPLAYLQTEELQFDLPVGVTVAQVSNRGWRAGALAAGATKSMSIGVNVPVGESGEGPYRFSLIFGVFDAVPTDPRPLLTQNSRTRIPDANGNWSASGSQDFEEGLDGRRHLAHVDLDGRMLYSTCSTRCELPERWSTTILSASGTTDSKPILKIGPDGRLHIAAHDGNFLSQSGMNYFTCAANCEVATGWRSNNIKLQSGADRGLLPQHMATEWFALDPQGRPRVAVQGERWEADPANPYNYSSWPAFWMMACEADCTDPVAWKTTLIREERGRYAGLSQPSSLDIDTRGRAHFLTREYIAGEGDRPSTYRLNYQYCDSNCAVPQSWSVPTTLREGVNLPLFWRFVPAEGSNPYSYLVSRPVELKYEENAELLVQACAADCANPANWPSTSLTVAGALPSFVKAVNSLFDARMVSNQLALALQTSSQFPNQSQLLREIVTTRCSGSCGAETWSVRAVDSTAGDLWPDENELWLYDASYYGLNGPSLSHTGRVAYSVRDQFSTNPEIITNPNNWDAKWYYSVAVTP